MKKQILNDALNEIKEEYIYDAKFGADIKIIKFKRKKIITAVACFVLVLLMVPAVIFGNKYFNFWPTDISSSDAQSSSTEFEHYVEIIENSKNQDTYSKKANSITSKNKTPIHKGAYFSAEQIDGFFRGGKMTGTKGDTTASTTAYKKVYFPNINAINLEKIPNDKYVTIYKTPIGKKYNKSEFIKFIDRHYNQLSAEYKFVQSEYNIEKDNGYEFEINAKEYNIRFNQTKIKNFISISNFNVDNSGNNNFIFKGITIKADQRLSDAEIIKSLTPLRNKFSEFFDTEFVNTDIRRDYGTDYGDTTISRLYVTFTNKETDNIKKEISFNFDNHKSYDGDIVTDGILYDVFSIHYSEERETDISENIELVKVKKISLQQAEELLNKGYTFGGNGCPYCESKQSPVKFDAYDYVGFEYFTPYVVNQDGSSYVLPFYTFYKYLETSKNGKLCYAKTYVPAFEVSGIEEYFLNKHSKH